MEAREAFMAISSSNSDQSSPMTPCKKYFGVSFAGSTHFKKCPGPAQAGWGWFRCWISRLKSSASANTSIYLEGHDTNLYNCMY